MDKAMELSSVIDDRPISRFQYRMLLMCSLVALLDGYDTQAIGYVAPPLAAATQTPMAAFGAVFSSGLLGTAIGAFAFGPLADRYGRRWTIIAACVAFSVFSFTTVFVTSFNQLIAIRFLTGLGLGGAVPSCLALSAEFAPKRVRGLCVTGMYSAFPLGGFVGGLTASYLLPRYGWESIFLVGGLAPLLISVALFFGLSESLRFLVARKADPRAIRRIVEKIAPELVGSDVEIGDAEGKLAAAVRSPIRALFSNGRAMLTLLLWAPFFLGYMVLLTVVLWAPTLLREAGIPLSTGALILAMHYLGGVIGTAASGYLVDRFGASKVLVPGFLTGAFCLFLFGKLTSTILLLGVVSFFCGVFVAGSSTGLIALAAAIYPTQMRSTGIGWAIGLGRAGQLFGPIAVGWMVATRHDTDDIFLMATIPCIMAAIFVGLLAVPAIGNIGRASLVVPGT